MTKINYQELYEQEKKEKKEMALLGTKEGFFKCYYDNLNKHRTSAECFNAMNDKYFAYFGEYRYACYYSFHNQLRSFVNKSHRKSPDFKS